MVRAVRMMPYDVYDCIFSWNKIQIKAFERKREKALDSFCKNFLLNILILRYFVRSKPLWPESCHRNFLYAAYFSVHPIEKYCQLYLFQEKQVSSFY